MTDILVLTVGTTADPLEQCISRLRPRRAVFVCSQGTLPLVDQILSRARVTSFDATRDVLVLSQAGAGTDSAAGEIDQLHAVYERCRDLLHRLRQQEPGARIWVDYTGGTKTMATGLGLAAIDDGGVDFSLMTGDRSKPGASMISGNSRPVQVNTGAIHFRRLISDGLEPLLQRFDYAAAQASVSVVLRMPQDAASSSQLRRLEDQLLALDAWDRWDLDRAKSLLGDRASEVDTNDRFLAPIKRVAHSCNLLVQGAQLENARKAIKHGNFFHGFEAVEDLLLNAARRASQERYDDAVGRLYRSMELTAQLLLLLDHSGIRTANVELELLPEPLRTLYEEKRDIRKGRIQLALVASFDLLADLGNPLGMAWRNRRSAFLDALEARNHSLLAHGFLPVTYTEWQRLDEVLGGFLRSVLDQRRGNLALLEQLPSSLAEMGLADVEPGS